MDFTFKKYAEILAALKNQNYSFQTFEEFIERPNKKVVVLRHDVDRRSKHSIDMARAEEFTGAKGTYYFRIVPESNNQDVIKEIINLGNEVGYHYEDLGLAKGDYKKAYEYFKKNLAYFRSFYPVKTICMHGSPESSIDNRDIWNKYDYKESGIIAEPYFDIDYNDIFYITDTGRTWNNKRVSVRDKVKTRYNITIYSSDHMIELIKTNELPDRIIINTHPHNWAKFGLLWFYILIWQKIKNVIKALLIIYKGI